MSGARAVQETPNSTDPHKGIASTSRQGSCVRLRFRDCADRRMHDTTEQFLRDAVHAISGVDAVPAWQSVNTTSPRLVARMVGELYSVDIPGNKQVCVVSSELSLALSRRR